jgi:hypothetical protein
VLRCCALLGLIVASVASAAPPANHRVPEPALSLGVVDVSLVDQFPSERPGEVMACAPAIAARLAVCLRESRETQVDGQLAVHRRWLAASDVANIVRPVIERLGVAEPTGRVVRVPDFKRSFWQTTGREAWAAPLIDPSAVRAALGATGPLLIAAPRDGLLMAWVPGDEAFDRAMAIGVREQFEAGPASISPAIVHHEGGAWRYFGQAVPR